MTKDTLHTFLDYTESDLDRRRELLIRDASNLAATLTTLVETVKAGKPIKSATELSKELTYIPLWITEIRRLEETREMLLALDDQN